jgi:hypothetical protein
MSSLYADIAEPGSVVAARMAWTTRAKRRA